ncbi:LacI family DNA-binding transcriptional regulator [Streptococcus porcinus]|uniref:Sugar-binding transcriptional regulator, LacI family n=2 Tax=Streptococcus porcinus TaxID=1340 RepID=A0A4V0H8U0_STRPO|nr:LacI family DNA-binding transcriptional regulator [Streptococcus porcinus]EGJ27526.1 sugar-binding domain protein [Streptococcus porcinus str. Jelinkova 176]SQG44856.1 sugar-binding transcriptional regulator, LacI family [Streptococcus porcinus]VTT45302.1 sugar-binding transcriptional regulator, LacI family [Streptococcus porcinus]VTT46800.1 sugar-binding transcriptional regulator, LacI family [Streptococcus porcinus]
MTTIRDIATIVGVAPSTISRYLNHSGYVSKETAEKIEKTIAELDYHPNQNAQNLSRGKTSRVGVVIPHTKHPYFIEIIKGLVEAAFDSHYQLQFLPSHYLKEKELAYLDSLRAKAFDALIFTSRNLDISQIAPYHKYGKIVLLEKTDSPFLSSISIDRQIGLSQLMMFLKKHNQPIKHPIFLFTRNEKSSATFTSTKVAYESIFGNTSSFDSLGNISSYEDGYKATKHFLGDKTIDAIITNSDDVAVGVIQYYQQQKKKIPLVVSQEAQISGKILNLPSIDNHSFQLGYQAFHLAIDSTVKHKVIKSKFLEKRY